MTKTAAEIFEDYLTDLIDGQALPIEELVARHPEHREILLKKFAAFHLLPSPLDAPMAGRVIDDFEIVREIGHGGMGRVYLARQRSLDREVALKVIERTGVTAVARLDRFRKEGQTIAKLDHRGIVPIHTFGEKDDLFYIAMKYVHGLPLSELVRFGVKRQKRSLTPTDLLEIFPGPAGVASNFRPPAGNTWVEIACTIVAEVAEAVAYAHRRKVLHRDIKPANIILRYNGQPVLLDFGLSKVLGDVSMTASTEAMGTPAFAAPEQLFEKHDAVDLRADIYGLGMTLYELLAFKLPYEGVSAAGLVASIARDEPIPLRQHNPDVPEELANVVMKAISKRPEDRFQTIDEFAEAVRPFSGKALGHGASGKKRRSKTKILLALFGAALFAATVHLASDTPRQSADAEIVSWKAAASFVGQHKTVEGTVLLTKCTPKACFLNFHPDWQNSFSAVVFASDFPNFPADIEGQYKGKTIRVSGLVEEYDGRPEIVLKDPGQVTVLK